MKTKGSRLSAGEKDAKKVVRIIDQAFQRVAKGKDTYGAFNPRKDVRELLKEAEEECLDAIAYIAFEVLRLKALRREIKRGGLPITGVPRSRGKRGRKGAKLPRKSSKRQHS